MSSMSYRRVLVTLTRLVPCFTGTASWRLRAFSHPDTDLMSTSQFAPRPKHHAYRIGRSRRRALYVVFSLLMLTGVLWLAVYWSRLDPEVGAPWQAWSMKIHGGAALASLFLIGTIWNSHIWHAWQRGRNRIAGSLLGSFLVLLILTGYGLYYFNGETLRAATEWIHWIVGGVLGLLFWLHLSLGRCAA